MPNHKHPDSISGIYAIICRVNGKKYYGSSYNCRDRKGHHWSDLKWNKHKNIYLQRAWNKYGAAAFDFVVVQRVPVSKLREVENQYLPFGDYNIFRDAERPTNTAPIERICRRCNKRFLAMACTKRNGRREFCSMDCYQAEHQEGTKIVVCKKCRNLFKCCAARIQGGRGRYCSKSCWGSRAEKTPKACKGCDNTLNLSVRSKRLFCSQKCYWNSKRTVEKRVCQQCAVVFLPQSHSSKLKYCSRQCFFKSGVFTRSLKLPGGNPARGEVQADLG